MGALANAAVLVKDPTFMDQCMAAAAYQARQVILEPDTTQDHASRLALATSVVADPLTFRTRFSVYIGTDPEVAAKGNTAALVGEQTILDKVAAIWTTVSKLGYTA
jgi:hypothetical protein